MPRKPKGEKKVQLSVYVRHQLYEQVSKSALELNTSMSNIVETALLNWFQNMEGSNDKVTITVPKEVYMKLIAQAMKWSKSIESVLLELLEAKKEAATT